MIQIQSASIKTIPPTNREVWYVLMDVDGNQHAHIFPVDTVEWRMAEYGIANPSVALDLVLAEPWMESDTKLDHHSPTHLYNASTIQDAREAILARAANVHAKHGFKETASRVAGLDPAQSVKQFILDRSPIDQDVIAVKAEIVRIARGNERNRRLVRDVEAQRLGSLETSSAASSSDRVAAYRTRLEKMVPGMTMERQINGYNDLPPGFAEARSQSNNR